jgi:hypothetical protein
LRFVLQSFQLSPAIGAVGGVQLRSQAVEEDATLKTAIADAEAPKESCVVNLGRSYRKRAAGLLC